jgi:FAD-dependent urate hydroxylase
MSLDEADVVVVGAGPYGLSLAAHLRARRVAFRIFGPPMKFWRDMPRGVNLKSLAFATNVFVPEEGFSFPEWCRARGLEDFEPCTMESFAAYGLWMKDRFVPEVEPVEVTQVSVRGRGFEVAVATGERLAARRVVLAIGLSYFARLPAALSGLPPDLASHTFFHRDYARFAGKEVAVLGAGASAIEAGALLHEAGARAEVLVRANEAIFHGCDARDRPLIERLRRPSSVLGPGFRNWAIEKLPLGLRAVPERQRVRFVARHLGPAAPWWIHDRVVGKVPIRTNTEVVAAERAGDRVRLHLREHGAAQRALEVDHVVAGTGYELDLDRLSVLDLDLRARLRRVVRAPALSFHFESSVRGLYFIGPVSSLSFGPLFRFVCGSAYTAPAVARHLAGPVREVPLAVRRWAAAVRSPAAW